jgi:hypothetical protein
MNTMNVGETRKGERLKEMPDNWWNIPAGSYGPLKDGHWAIHPPGGYVGHLSPRVHQITEHDDGTITVSPSILQQRGDNKESWHGFLERGIWRRV